MLTSFILSVSSVTFDSTTFTVTAVFRYITVKEVSTGFDINWGNPTPADCSTASSGGSGATTSAGAAATSGIPSATIATLDEQTTTPNLMPSSGATTSAAAAATSGIPSTPIVTVDEQANFDEVLDAELGVMDSTAADFYALLLPGVDSSTVSTRDLSKRSIFSILKSLVKYSQTLFF
jgi:hypothetical protein